MFFNELTPQVEGYRVVEILPEHYAQLYEAIRQELQIICFGRNYAEQNPDLTTYMETCKKISNMLSNKDERKRIGIIGELLMHLIVPQVFGARVETVSRLLSMSDDNIKHGFDLNYLDLDGKKLWYGEVKSSAKQKRSRLIAKARDGLNKYFSGYNIDGPNNTIGRWQGLMAEFMMVYKQGTKKYDAAKRILDLSRSGVMAGHSKNALLMVVNFNNSGEALEEVKDIKRILANIKERKIFDECLVISATREFFDDIFEFIKEEAHSGKIHN